MKNLINTLLSIGFFLLLVSESNAQEGIVKANGITIAYESFGNRNDEAIILIQGTGATMLHYPAEMCRKLSGQGYYVIRFDNRDIGLSAKLDSLGEPDWGAIFPLIGKCEPVPLPYTLLDMANDVIGLMDALGIKNAHIAGASMGGAIAQLVAIHFPERTLSLTSMAASSGNPNLPKGEESALAAMGTPPPLTDDTSILADYLVNVYKAIGAVDDDRILKKRALGHINRSWYPEGTNRQVAAVLIGDNCDRRKELAKISIPTLVVHGDKDPLVTIESGKEVATTIPNAELCIIKGMGHDISLKFVDEIVNCMLKNFEK
jgi:pimeloyl-ACP methyl ester carboxylesterase